jgi:hypothetical protein
VLKRALDLALRGLAAVLTLSLAASAWHDVSQAYDVWYYHLPFAARLAGIMDASTYAFSADNQARFAGFPLLGELLQGLIWRATDHLAAANLVALGSLVAIPVFLRHTHGVPHHLALLALLAVPLVQIHATSCYVDLPANACATLLLLCVHRALVRREPPTPRSLAGCALLAAAAANMKFQLVPIVAVAAATLVALSLRQLPRWRSLGAVERSATRARMLVLACAVPLVLATPIKNTALHGNPVWPVELVLFGRSLPHVEDAYESSPRHLAGTPRPIRFLRSALEIDNRPIASRRRWSLDQWTPPDEPGLRMGGYFGAYVLVGLVALGAAARRRTREAIAAAALFAVVTVVAALVPQSHELRYYMHWMMLLVSLALVLWARDRPLLTGLVATSALAIVAWSTDAGYLYPSGSTIDELVTARVDRRTIDAARPGQRLCVARRPFTILYAPLFHARKDYAVQEAATEADCARSP